MAGQGQGISVPISLQISNLQSIVNMLQSKLSNLKVGTAGFKSLQTIISTIQKDIDKLAIQTDKPFVSANQFTAADRAVNKLEEDLDKVQIAVSRIKFSDLELDPSQAAELKTFETQIESIKNSLKTVKETAKQAFLDSDVGKGWAHDHAEATTQTLSQLTTAITKEVQKQTTELDQAKKAFSDYQQAIQASKNINNFMSRRSGHQLSEATMGKELFNKIFKTDDTGEVSKFQNGGKTLLQQWLQQQFNLDSATVQSLTEGAGQAVVKAFAEIGGTVEAALKAQQIKLRNAATEQKTTTNNGSTLEAAIKEKTEKLNQTEAAQAQLVASNTSVSASEAQLRIELEQTKAQLAEYKERLAEAVRTNPDWVNSNKQANVALEQLKTTLNQTNAQFLQQQRVMQNFNSMKMAVVNFMGFNQILNLTKTAVREAINHIKELDTVMNGIAIVTDMSTGDLWTQIDQYSKMAQAYGVSITGAYEVSQIYYQQGLETADVMTLTNETLKLAKISGLDYATTTDYMTTAIRGFKMEMSDAAVVVDVYSNLAAHTAVSQEELAVAMSKTASSMEGVGATFEEASAMIGTMVAVTRESATNIGSAMKSIASRYGELTKDPTKLVDEEGEAMAFNKVDAALQSVGISMKTVDGQFREFTDVIVELGEKWDELDSTQQRYIATQFAGNRQQSRFLALVSNVDLLKSNLDVAMNSEDTGTLQALKALDSIESKIEQVKVAYQQFYTTIGIESAWKGLLDATKNVINTLNSLPKLFGKIPIAAIAVVGNIITLIKGLLTRGIQGIASIWTSSLNQSGTQATTQGQTIGRNLMTSMESAIKAGTPAVQAAINAALSLQQQTNSNIIPLNKEQQSLFNIGNNNFKRNNSDWQQLAENYTKKGLMSQTEFASAQKAAAEGNEEAYRQAVERSNEAIRQQNGLLRENTNETNNNTNATNTSTPTKVSFFDKLKDGSSKLNRGLSATAMALTTVGMVLDKSSEAGQIASGVFTGLGGALQTGTAAARVFAGDLGALPQLVMGVINIINGFSLAIETPVEKLERLTKEAEELSNKAKEAKAEYRTLDNSVKKFEELREKRYESTEATEEYQAAVDDLAEKFPELIISFDNAGNAIIDETNATNLLAEARKKSAEAASDAAKGEIQRIKQEKVVKRSNIKDNVVDLRNDLLDYTNDNNFYSIATQLMNALENEDYDWESNQAKNLFGSFQEEYEQLKEKYKDVSDFVVDDEIFQEILSTMPDLTSFLPKIKGQERIMISAWQQTQDQNGQAWNYLVESSQSAALVTKAIEETFAKHGDYEINDANYDIIVRQWENRDYMTEMNNFWLQLGLIDEDYQKKFDEMLSDSSNYTTEDFKKVFGDIDGFENIESMLIDYYTDNLTTIQERIQKRIEQLTTDDSGKIIEGKERYNKISTRTFKNLTEEKYVNKLINAAEDLDNRGLDNYANDIITQGLELFDAIETLNGDTQKVLYKVIFENGFSSVDGLQAIIDYINNTETITDKDALIGHLTPMLKYTISNINLSMQAAASNIFKTFDDTSKELQKITSTGFSLPEAEAFLNKAKSLGLTWNLDTFIQSGDKLILTAEMAQQYWNTLNASNNAISEQYQKKINKANTFLSGINSTEFTENTLSDENIQLFEEIGFDWRKYFNNETKEWIGGKSLKSVVKFSNELQEAITLSQNNLDNLTETWVMASNIMKKTWDYSQGNYGKSIEELKQIAQETSFDRTTQEGADRKAIHDSLNEAYNNLISDVLSKGFNNIDLSSYSGLINDADAQAALDAVIKEGNYVEFIQEYVKFATNSIDEANELLAQAMQKETERTSSEVLSNLQFINQKQFTASLSDLTELANRFDIGLDQLTTNWNQALGAYIVDFTKFKEFDNFTGVENYQAIINDSINEFFNNLVSLIKTALSGSLSNADRGKLDEWVASYNESFGADLKLDFTKTAEGLKMSEDSAISLYNALKQVDALQASLMFDELNKSLQESNEHYKSISSIEARIAELNREIAKLPADDKRIKQYEEELALAKEIKEVRSTSEDSGFEFMSNKIPGGQNNPLNYWKNWGEAWKTLKKSSKTGTMDYTAFYNIVTEMGNLAEKSGGIAIGAKTVLKNSQDAADLIDAAAQSLKIDAHGELVVDLKNLSKLGFDFKAAGAGMAKGVEAGIKTIAQSEIDMLDSMISLLETIVAMQALGDLDVNGDIEISVPEILLSEDGKTADGRLDETGQWIEQYGSKYKATRQKIIDNFTDDDGKVSQVLTDVTVKGHSMLEILNTEESQLREWGIKAQDLSLLLTNLYKLSQSDEFDVDKPWESFMNIFSSMDWGDLTIGSNAGNHAIILTDDGSYSVEWNSDAAKKKVRGALDEWKDLKDEEIEEMCQKAVDAKNAGNALTVEQNYLLKVLTGDIKVITEDGKTKYHVNGKPYDSYEDAVKASDIIKTGATLVETEDKDIKGKITFKEGTIDVTTDGNGKITYMYDGEPYSSKEEALQAAYKNLGTGEEAIGEDGTTTKAYSKWKVEQGLEVMPVITFDKSGFVITPEVQAHAQELISKGDWPGLERDFPVTINPSFKNGTASAEDLAELKAAFGIESKTIDLNASVTSTGDVGMAAAIESGTAEVAVTATVTTSQGEGNDLTSGISGVTDGLTIALAEGASVKLAEGQELKVDLSDTTVTGENADLEVSVSDNIALAANTVVKVKDPVNALADASSIEVNLPEDSEKRLATIEEDGLKLESIDKGTADLMMLEVNLTEGTDQHLADSSVINVSDKVAALAEASSLTISLGEAAFISLAPKESDDGYDVGCIGNAAGIADKLTVSTDSGTHIALADNLVVSITDGIAALATATSLLVSLSETAFVSLNTGENGKPIDVGSVGNATAAVDTLTITEYDNLVTPDDINGTATITAVVDDQATQPLNTITSTANKVEASDPKVNVTEEEEPSGIASKLKDISDAAEKIPATKNTTITLSLPSDYESLIDKFISKIREVAKTWKVTFEASKTGNWPSDVSGTPWARGNVGPARASGNTLMGELGPELVVQQGRYFVAGQQGAEFVDLAPDAIVFNHLQTEQLLKNGMSNERGRAVTNERVAAAFAHGNVNGGPAMASANAALTALKQLRSMWKSLLGASAKDLAGTGGGGGGGGDKDKTGNFVKELEKWYNWLQEIAELEEQINYQEKLRSKIQSDMIPHGQDIATSYMTSLDALEKEIAVQEDLRNAQQEYFDQRRAWMNSNQNPFSSLYTFDENGQLKYANGKLEELSNMVGRNEEGKANYDAKEQYEMIQAMGYGDFLKYDSSGKEIEFYQKDEKGNYKLDNKGQKIVNADAYTTAVQAFWDKIDADKEEMQSLHDSINEHRDAVLEKQQAMNEILKSIEDNQIAVENKVLDAMIDSREREIEESEKERDAIEKSSQSLIKGLSDQLGKERAMYEQQQDKNELNSLQRRLGILQRSGGSASEIASLQEQISQKQQDAYFEAQQNQIDALQEASDNELARLDAQIELAKETLEYEKMHGLLWQKVSDVLAKSPTDIATYIQQNNSKYWGQSRTQLAQTIREDLMKAMEFKKIQENFDVIAAYYKAFDDAANAGAKGKWTQDEQGRWQYQKANGDLAKDSWEKVDDKWYRFDENGYMQTGWVKDQDQWYHLDEKSGAMDTSWFHDKDDKWYYLDETSGAMLSNTTKQLMWNGEKANHSFDESGAWTGSTPIEATEETKEEEKGQNEENSSNENKKYKVTYKITGTSGDLSPDKTTGYGIGNTEQEARNNAQNLAKRKANSIANAKISYSNPVQYEYGGIVQKDGEGYLHAKEGVLTAQQTSTLRNEILGHRNDSLLSLLTDFREAWSETKNAYSSITRDSSVVIEHAEVNMNVESIDNDYGAQRAGEQALNQMMQIARKTQAQNRVS